MPAARIAPIAVTLQPLTQFIRDFLTRVLHPNKGAGPAGLTHMMDSNIHPGAPRLPDLINDLVTEYGAGRVTRVLLANLLVRLRRPRADTLSNHLRRDMGLPPHDPPPGPPPGFHDLMR